MSRPEWIKLRHKLFGDVRVRTSSVVAYFGWSRVVITRISLMNDPNPPTRHEVHVHFSGDSSQASVIEEHASAEAVAARIAELDGIFTNTKETG